MSDLDHVPRRRVFPQDNQQARTAVAGVVSRFGEWRSALSMIAAKVSRPQAENERRAAMSRCAEIRREVGDVRAELTIRLASALPRVRGHSRVVDVVKALDGVEAMLNDLESSAGT
jgi:hypothetical protein